MTPAAHLAVTPGRNPDTSQPLAVTPGRNPDTSQPLEAGLAMAASGWSWSPREPYWRDGLLDRARQFIALFYSENRLGPPDRRLWHVRHEIEEWGTYRHTPQELAFGARMAWRNSTQGIGRVDWKSVLVRDRREVTSAAGIAAESVTHLHEAANGGRGRPVITVFAPDAPGRPGPRILNAQLVGYAGYQAANGVVTGDPENAGLTRLARSAGWPGGQPAGQFDILPLLVQEAGGPITVHEIPTEVVHEVTVTHPEFRWFAGPGPHWRPVPVISDRYLAIGGVHYPAAPFNGWPFSSVPSSGPISSGPISSGPLGTAAGVTITRHAPAAVSGFLEGNPEMTSGGRTGSGRTPSKITA